MVNGALNSIVIYTAELLTKKSVAQRPTLCMGQSHGLPKGKTHCALPTPAILCRKPCTWFTYQQVEKAIKGSNTISLW